MSTQSVKEFQKERERLNSIVLKYSGKTIKRFYNLDFQAYQEGVLPVRTKELLGLVASLVLRCDDCVSYHIIRCHEEGLSDQELEEALSVGVMVGGTITIPHLRRALDRWDELKKNEGEEE